jgi:hypothetical protein
MNLIERELGKSIAAEREALPDRLLSAFDGVGENLIIIMYELGSVARGYVFTANKKLMPEDELASEAANSITELQDVVTQSLVAFRKLRKLTNNMKDMTVEEFIIDGLQRQQVRMNEVIKGVKIRR